MLMALENIKRVFMVSFDLLRRKASELESRRSMLNRGMRNEEKGIVIRIELAVE